MSDTTLIVQEEGTEIVFISNTETIIVNTPSTTLVEAINPLSILTDIIYVGPTPPLDTTLLWAQTP